MTSGPADPGPPYVWREEADLAPDAHWALQEFLGREVMVPTLPTHPKQGKALPCQPSARIAVASWLCVPGQPHNLSGPSIHS